MALKDKKTKITFHNGILTIGGTIIEVVYEDSHIFFDFGSEYNPKAPVQPEKLQEEAQNSVDSVVISGNICIFKKEAETWLFLNNSLNA